MINVFSESFCYETNVTNVFRSIHVYKYSIYQTNVNFKMRNVAIEKKGVGGLNKINMCLPNDLLLLNKLNKLWSLRLLFFQYILLSL